MADALATVAQLAAWVGETIDSADLRALALLDAASTLVRSEASQVWADPETAPADVVMVVVQVAARVWRNPSGAIQDTTGPFTVRWSERMGDGMYLTETERDILFRYNQRPPIYSIDLLTPADSAG